MLPVIVAAAAAGVAGCASDQPSPQPSTSATSAEPTVSPTGAVNTYQLGAASYLIIGSDPGKLTTGGGTLNVQFAGERPTPSPAESNVVTGTYTISAQSTVGPAWQLTLNVTSQNRALDGTLVFGGLTWQVVPTTGLIESSLTPTHATFSTERAVTVLRNNRGDNIPLTFSLTGTGSNPVPSPSAS